MLNKRVLFLSFLSISCMWENLVSGESPFPERTIDEWRQATRSFGNDAGKAAQVSSIDRTISARDGYPLRCRIFNDEFPADSPVFVFYPGCAFVFDLFDVNSIIASRIAEISKVKVVLVQFRLAPEHSVLTCLQDSYDAAHYIASHPEAFGIDPGNFFIGGWCSGANAATFVSKAAHDSREFTVRHQVLLSGSFDLSHSFHEFDEYEAQDSTLKRELVAHFAHLYYSMDSDKTPLFSPQWVEDCAHFPPTTLICGEYDALRNDTEAYFRKLQTANVAVDRIILKGQSHNEVVMRKASSFSIDPAEEIAIAIRKHLKK